MSEREASDSSAGGAGGDRTTRAFDAAVGRARGAGDARPSSALQAWLDLWPGEGVRFSVIEHVGDVYELHARDSSNGREASYGEPLPFDSADGRWARSQVRFPVELFAKWALICGWDRMAELHERGDAASVAQGAARIA